MVGTLLLVLVLIILTTLLLIRTKNSSEKLLETRRELVYSQSQKEKIMEFDDFYKEHQGYFYRTDHLMVDGDAPIEFIQFLEGIDENLESSLEIISISSEPEIREGDEWKSLIFEINFRGEFADLLRVLMEINKSFYLLDFKELEVTENHSEDEFVNALFSMKVFVD